MTEFTRIILLFIIYSIVGWLWETIYCSLKARKFVYRGFLIGPYCPIYGFGVLSVLYFIEPYQNNILVLYIFSAIVVTVLEYVTSFALEKLFHASWWDYKDVPLNINGRIALPISLFWGFACVLIVEVIHPKMLVLENFLAQKFGVALPIILLILMGIDVVYTVTNMLSFRKASQKWTELIESSKEELLMKKSALADELKENLVERKGSLEKSISQRKLSLELSKEEWLAIIKEKQGKVKDFPSLSFNQRRMLQSFSKLNLKEIKDMDELKDVLKVLKKK